MKRFLCLLTIALASLLSIDSAVAQVTSASMSGRIKDAKGPLEGVAVIAVHQPTGAQFYSITDASGYFYLTNITAGGPYNVTISCLGYSTVEYKDIHVALADNYVINEKMQEESMKIDAVTVVAEGKNSNMSSERSGAITSLDTRQISQLPTLSRSMNDLLMQTPQAYSQGGKTFIGGGSYRQSFVTVDGAAFNNAFGIGSNLPANGSPISLDALEQVSIAITPYDVRQSGFIGGGINATTRSGSNRVKATAYGYFRNHMMEGNKVGDVVLTRTPSHYFMYGASVGAPIIKDKLFIFVNVEADRSVHPGPTRRLASDMIVQNGQLVPNPDGGEPFINGNNGIARPHAGVLDAISGYVRDKYGYDTGKYLGYNTLSPSLKLLARVDWNIHKNHKLNVRYSLTNSKGANKPSGSSTGLPNSSFSSSKRTSMDAMYFQNARYNTETNFSSVAAELNSRFLDGRLNNVLRVSYSHQNEPRSYNGGYFPFVDMSVGGNIYTSFGVEPFTYGNLRDVSTVIATDEITYNIGRHSILGGLQFEYNMTKNGFQRMGAGHFVFEYDDEQEILDGIAGDNLFDHPSQFAITHGNNSSFKQEFPRFEFEQFSIYLQDNITFSNNFKLTAGVRLELPFYPKLDFNYNDKVAHTQFRDMEDGKGGFYDTRELPKTKVMVSPRIGFNWDIMGDRKYVLRGGTGIFTGRIPFVWIVSQAGDAGVLQTSVHRLGDACPTIGNDRDALLGQIYPDGFSQEEAGKNITSITLMDSRLKMPQTWKSSLAVDVRIPGDVLLSLEGIYNYDIHPVTVTNIGLKAPVQLTGKRPFYANGTYDSQIKEAYLLTNVKESSLWGHYFSLTAKVEKSFWKGFSGSLAYTYSTGKNVNDGVGDQLFSVWNALVSKNGANSQELGYASYIMPHRLVLNLNYTKDYAKYFGTSVSLSYYAGNQGRMSYLYKDNVVGDGGKPNQLIDIPTYDNLFGNGPDKWQFEEYTVKNMDGVKEVYTAEQQAKDFWAYIQQDRYLSKHTGETSERNAGVYPWHHRVDFKINQNFYFYTGQKHNKHTVQLGLDIQNVGNLLSRNWGAGWSSNASTYGNAVPITIKNAYNAFAKGDAPIYQYQMDKNVKLLETFHKNAGFGSTWNMMVSLRYIF